MKQVLRQLDPSTLLNCPSIRILAENCHRFFPVPFDEDDRDDSVWFLDHDYLENMYGMFKKVNGKAGHVFTIHFCSVLQVHL